ncbi:MAG: protein tyrosine phosphatase [Spirosoma sp.]|nr:protein tyrosine phosphatase [Spirosoma sp.]
MNSILVLCEGNICRSPMAQGVLAAALPKMQVRSAGLGALIGMPADEIAVRLMKERSIDIAEHRATQINRQMCLDADVVLVMGHEQRSRVESLYPQSRGRVFRLGEYTNQDIPDPYRQPEAAFRHSLTLIQEASQEWLRRIHKL